ncbi:MAG: IgGFc-binding protein [Flavobacteriaceae bacterium]|jgi:hypothetical protein|nr:IgGFc-binding protein [Flavobacteriaceae bacterium]
MKKLTLKTATMKQLKTIIITAITTVFYFLPSFGGVGGGGAYAQVAGAPYIVPAPEEEESCPFTTEGRDFWVTFLRATENDFFGIIDPGFFLKITTGNLAADVTLTFTEGGANSVFNYHINGYSAEFIDLSKMPLGGATFIDKRSAVRPIPNGGIPTPPKSQKTLHITSTTPVSVYAFNTGQATTDATIVMPVPAWGMNYYMLGYRAFGVNSDEIIIAATNGTTLSLVNDIANTTTPIMDGANPLILNRGDVYYTRSDINGDLTGRHITSNYPVAYFTHSEMSQIPFGYPAGDILWEQLSPVDSWGKTFLVPNTLEYNNSGNNIGNHIRIIASENNTKVEYFSGAIPVTTYNDGITDIPGDTPIGSGGILQAGQWFELEIPRSGSNSCFIKADKAVGVAAYMTGKGGVPGQGYGDPAITRIPAIDQLTPDVTVSPFLFPTLSSSFQTTLDEPGARHFMIIIAPTASKDNISVITSSGAVTLDPNQWIDNPDTANPVTNPGGTAMSYYDYEFEISNDPNKAFNVIGPDGVIVLAYGIYPAESYYYNAGSGACVINP